MYILISGFSKHKKLNLSESPQQWYIYKTLILILSSNLHLQYAFPPDCLTKILYTFLIFPMRASCTVHLSVLGFISWTFFGELSKIWISPTTQFLETAPTTFSYCDTSSATVYFQTPSIRTSRSRTSRVLRCRFAVARLQDLRVDKYHNNKYQISRTSVQWRPSYSMRKGKTDGQIWGS